MRLERLMAVMEDVKFGAEMIGGDAAGRKTFEGRCGPVVGVHGIFGGWPKNGLREYMNI